MVRGPQTLADWLPCFARLLWFLERGPPSPPPGSRAAEPAFVFVSTQ